MYTSFSIENFRLFDQLTVEPLARVNLIAGQNNAGKTALLEALWLHTHPTAPRPALQIDVWRDLMNTALSDLFSDLFLQQNTELDITLSALGTWGKASRKLKINRRDRPLQLPFEWPDAYDSESGEDSLGYFDFEHEIVFDYIDETGNHRATQTWLDASSMSSRLRPMLRENKTSTAKSSFPCSFEHTKNRFNTRALARMFSRAEIGGYLPFIEEVMRLLEPRLNSMTMITDSQGHPLIYGNLGNGYLAPMALMGEGVKRLLAMALNFWPARGGIILIDEIENGLHHSALSDVWKNIERLSRELGVQVFATTHSYECIVAAHNAFTELESDELHLHRLYRRSSSEPVKAMTYT